MKMKWVISLAGLCGVLMIVAPRSAHADVFSFGFEIRHTSDFHEPLRSHGYWVETHRYGLCWFPSYVDRDWRPYTDGYWVWTDAGWYWASDEPWAWATYHYGRWAWDEYYGWVWVPGIEWAPAWVCWRWGGGYIGWAPMPPGCDFDPFDNVIYFERIVIPWHAYVFVQHRHFCHPIRRSTIIVNQTIINQTINITKVQRVNNVVINNGPSVRVVEREAGRKLTTVPAIDMRRSELKRAAEQPKIVLPPQKDRESRPEKPRTPVILRGPERDEPRPPTPKPVDDLPRVQPRRDYETPRPVLTPTPKLRQPNVPMPKRPAVAQREEHARPTFAPPGQLKKAPPAPTVPPVVSPSSKSSPGEGRKVGQDRKHEEDTLTGGYGGKRQVD